MNRRRICRAWFLVNVCGRLRPGFHLAAIKPITPPAAMTVDAYQRVADLVGHDVAEPARDRRVMCHRDALDAVVEEVPATARAAAAAGT